MKEILDKGHLYKLLTLDGDGHWSQTLRFVKRCEPPEKYPGNYTSHFGTTLQSVIRCLIERATYLQGQFWCLENWIMIKLLRYSLWLLEFRAARRHGHGYWHTPSFAAKAPMCKECGHTQCEHVSS